MRLVLTGFASLALIGFLASPVSASTLTEKNYETSFALAYEDADSFGKTTTLNGQWQWIFGKGYHELGGKLSYLNIDPDIGSGSDAVIIGPVYTWNWMPDQEKGTGFLEAAYGSVSGDLSDFVDAAWLASVGAKIFVGDSAAVRFEYFFQRMLGADNFADEDSSGIQVGISIFGGKK